MEPRPEILLMDIVSLLIFLLGLTLSAFALWLIRDGKATSREIYLEKRVEELSNKVEHLQNAIQSMTDAWLNDRNKLALALAQNRDLLEEVAALTGRTARESVKGRTLAILRQAITEKLTAEELTILAADLSVDIEALGGETQAIKAMRLIQHLEKRERLGELIHELRRTRPEIKLDIE